MSSLTIGKKLFLSVGILLVLVFALGLTAFLGINSIGARLHTAVGPTSKKQSLSGQLALGSEATLNNERAVMIRGYTKQLDKAESFNAAAQTSMDQLQGNLQQLLAISTRPQAIQTIQEFSETIPPMREASKAIIDAVKADDMPKALSTFDTALLPASKKQQEVVEHLEELERELAASDSAAAESSVTLSEWITGGVLLLSALIGILAVFVVRGVNSFLRSIMQDLGSASSQIAAAATEVSGASQAIAQGASEQAATVEETSSASSEINSMAQRNMENARSASDLVKHSQDRVGHTGQSLDEMVVAMDGITASSQKISKIIKVIDEIAFQTNILALNAAVEAARAGDAGMGFAVVADEVRNLAQRSAQAAKDTTDLIEESIQQSSGGKAKVDQVAAEFKAIADESLKMKVLIDEISLGSVEQSRGIDQISSSISQIEQAVQGSASSAEETASAAEELQSQSQGMTEIVDSLARMVDRHGVSQSGAFDRPAQVKAVVKTVVKTAVARTRKFAPSAQLTPAGSAAFPMDDRNAF